MKYFYLILIFLFFNCTKNHILVELDDELDRDGIDIWGRSIRYTWNLFQSPDITIEKGDPSDDFNKYIGYHYKDEKRIVVKYNKAALIAHEFGHYLGMKHTINPESIMYWYKVLTTNVHIIRYEIRTLDIDKNLNEFEEFKNY